MHGWWLQQRWETRFIFEAWSRSTSTDIQTMFWGTSAISWWYQAHRVISGRFIRLGISYLATSMSWGRGPLAGPKKRADPSMTPWRRPQRLSWRNCITTFCRFEGESSVASQVGETNYYHFNLEPQLWFWCWEGTLWGAWVVWFPAQWKFEGPGVVG